MSIDAPTKIINMPTGDLYQHPMFSSYTMFSHRETLTKIDKMGYVLSKTTERLTILESLVEDQRRTINELTANQKQAHSNGAKTDNTPRVTGNSREEAKPDKSSAVEGVAKSENTANTGGQPIQPKTQSK